MTICLAAIARDDKEEFIVFATDHMVTTAIGQFEHSIVKYKEIDKNTVAMLAGNPLIFDELIKVNKNSNFDEIQTQIFQNFKKTRKEFIKREIFDIYNIDDKFFLDSLQKPIPNPIIATILKQVSEFRLGTGILLIGFDKQGNARIADISEDHMVNFRDMNFHAIGSGNIQAANTLLFQRHDKSDNLLSTIYNVYKAKRNAEVLQGVGRETELLVLKKSGCHSIKDKNLEILKDIYEEELNFGKKHGKLSGIKFDWSLKICS